MISVIIVTKSERPIDLQNCINSLTKQTFKDFEVILVIPKGLGFITDLYPVDDRKSVILGVPYSYGSIEVRSNLDVSVIEQTSVGICNARNCGVKESSGEIIAFTDDDAEPYPDWLEKINNRFTEHLELAYLGGEFVLESHNIWQKWIDKRYHLNEKSINLGLCHGNNMAYRREVFKSHLFDEGIRFGADESEFQGRLRKSGIVGRTFKDILIKHQHRSSFLSFSEMRWKYAQGKVYVQEEKNDTELFHWDDLMNITFFLSLGYAILLIPTTTWFWLLPCLIFILIAFNERKKDSSIPIWLVDIYVCFLWTLSKMYYSFRWHLKRWMEHGVR